MMLVSPDSKGTLKKSGERDTNGNSNKTCATLFSPISEVLLSKRPTNQPPQSPETPSHPLRLEWIEAGSLAENPLNWRRHPDAQVKALKDVIGDPSIGWAGACLYNERTGRLIDGHARKNVRYGEIAQLVEQVAAVPETIVETSANDAALRKKN
jgi:hypothetical protein